MNSFFQKLRRRNVVRVVGVYAVIGWILAQVANTLEETMNLPQCKPVGSNDFECP